MIYLIEGPVGAGKSTYATKLAADLPAARFNLDEWMVTLFSPDRPPDGFMAWYSEMKQRCLQQIQALAAELHSNGIPVVLELGLVSAGARDAFYTWADDLNLPLRVNVLQAPRDERRQRVRRRNTEQGDTYKMHVSDEIFAIADAAWQAPDGAEISARSIELIST